MSDALLSGLRHIQGELLANQGRNKQAGAFGGGFGLPWRGIGAGLLGALGHTGVEAANIGKSVTTGAGRAKFVADRAAANAAHTAAVDTHWAKPEVAKIWADKGGKGAFAEHVKSNTTLLDPKHVSHFENDGLRNQVKDSLVTGHTPELQKSLDAVDAAHAGSLGSKEHAAAIDATLKNSPRQMKGPSLDTAGDYMGIFGERALKRGGVYGGAGAAADMGAQAVAGKMTRDKAMPWMIGGGAAMAGLAGYSALKD